MTQNDSSASAKMTTRRSFLKWVRSSAVVAVAAPTLLIPRSRYSSEVILESINPIIPKTKEERALSVVNLHTGDSLNKCIFWADGAYDPDALKSINSLFRDHRTQDIHEIDQDLLNLLHTISKKLDIPEPFHLISGYRSKKSNRHLKSHGRGVAKNSQHLYGKAADISVPGRTMKQIQLAAKSLQAGGVGRYPTFVHVDTGRVRSWGLA